MEKRFLICICFAVQILSVEATVVVGAISSVNNQFFPSHYRSHNATRDKQHLACCGVACPKEFVVNRPSSSTLTRWPSDKWFHQKMNVEVASRGHSTWWWKIRYQLRKNVYSTVLFSVVWKHALQQSWLRTFLRFKRSSVLESVSECLKSKPQEVVFRKNGLKFRQNSSFGSLPFRRTLSGITFFLWAHC